MLGHIGNLHTHAAFALVDDEASVLENGVYLLALVVEVVEGDEVAKQTVEVAVYMEELVDHIDALGLFLECGILCDEGEQCLLLVIGKQLLYGVDTERLHFGTFLGCFPCVVCGKCSSYGSP